MEMNGFYQWYCYRQERSFSYCTPQRWNDNDIGNGDGSCTIYLAVSVGEQAKNLSPMVRRTTEHGVNWRQYKDAGICCTTQRLAKVLDKFWTKRHLDVGLCAIIQPIHLKLQPGVWQIFVRQYPLSKKKHEGIRNTIAQLQVAGMLLECQWPHNTPLNPVEKPGKADYRLVNDLRKINIAFITSNIPSLNLYMLLANIEANFEWFTLMDLSNTFFCVPITPESRQLLVFTYENKQYTYTRLPQGLSDSPSLWQEFVVDLGRLCVAVYRWYDRLLEILGTTNNLASWECKVLGGQ